jgi:hypothetical protein
MISTFVNKEFIGGIQYPVTPKYVSRDVFREGYSSRFGF